MSLLNHQIHYNVSSHKDVLAKIRNFALARGWTSDHYETGVQWANTGGGYYDWIAGNEDFLQLWSDAHGSQNMVFRFRATGSGADPQEEILHLTGIEPARRALDHASSYHPVDRYSYTHSYSRRLSLSPGQMPCLWLFGDDQFIFAIIQMTAGLVQGLFFGTVELFDTSDVLYLSLLSQSPSTTLRKWYEAESWLTAFRMPFYFWQDTYNIYWCNTGVGGSGTLRYNLRFTHEQAQGYFNKLDQAVAANNFSGKRTLIKPTVFMQRASDSLWYPVGTFPIYWIVYEGLQIGQTLTYGTEQYLCFPSIYSSAKYGIAARVV